MDIIPRVETKMLILGHCMIAVFMGAGAGFTVFSASYDSVPSAIMPFIIAFLSAFFLFVLFNFFYGLTALHTIEISSEELRVRLGPVTLKRISADRVKTVGIFAEPHSRGNSTLLYLLLLIDKPRDELNQKGQKYIKRKALLREMEQVGLSATGPDAAAKAYLFACHRRSLLWIEDSKQTREVLHRYLSSAEFIY